MPFTSSPFPGHRPGVGKRAAKEAALGYARQLIGYKALAGRAAGVAIGGAGLGANGVCLGLGLGLGAWAPMLVVGATVAGGYLFLRNHARSTADAPVAGA